MNAKKTLFIKSLIKLCLNTKNTKKKLFKHNIIV